MKAGLKALGMTVLRFAAAQPFVVLCLSLMVTLPTAAALSHDFASAYMFTGLAVLVAASLTLAAMVAGDRLDKQD